MTLAFVVLILLSAALELWGEYRPARTWVYVFKPLTTLLILGLAVYRGATAGFEPSALWIAVGLVFSLAGDVFLMLPDDRFIPGLLSFFVAHLCYIAAFTAGRGFSLTPWLLLAFVACGAIVYRLLWPGLQDLRWPVLGYLLGILTMGWQAWERYLALGGPLALAAAIGASCFILSDATLAWQRFRRDFVGAPFLVMLTYYLAQLLIALSVGA
ncbi:MAG TPA: lysoplasmalogenase [Anaerolineae bacterium]|nr:lysoplasmalogenase [Anaerolineae bacterium]HXK43010.1 lysoplasmalogenase [Anaerolineae bacterium]